MVCSVPFFCVLLSSSWASVCVRFPLYTLTLSCSLVYLAWLFCIRCSLVCARLCCNSTLSVMKDMKNIQCDLSTPLTIFRDICVKECAIVWKAQLYLKRTFSCHDYEIFRCKRVCRYECWKGELFVLVQNIVRCQLILAETRHNT